MPKGREHVYVCVYCVYGTCVHARAVGCVYTRVCIVWCMCIWYAHMECVCIVCINACVHIYAACCVCTHVSLCGDCAYGLFVWGVCVCGTWVHIYVVMCVHMCVVYVCMVCSHALCVCVHVKGA